MRTFINGVKVGEFVLPLPVTDNRTLSNGYIGRSNWSDDNYANMNLNYLSVYNRVLTADEIGAASIYLATSGYYPQYTVGSAPTVSGSTLQFRGSNWLNYPGQTYDMSKGFSLVIYFMFTTSVGWQTPLDFANGPGNNNILFTQNGNVANTFRFSIYSGTTEYACDGGGITVGTYQKFIGVYDPVTKTITSYVNGVKVSALALSSAITDTRTLQNCYIGRSNWDNTYANMNLSYLAIYNRVLTADEI
jgi:hypothetical protein